jgi:hypothetical protein
MGGKQESHTVIQMDRRSRGGQGRSSFPGWPERHTSCTCNVCGVSHAVSGVTVAVEFASLSIVSFG